jgi:hypothetical protein
MFPRFLCRCCVVVDKIVSFSSSSMMVKLEMLGAVNVVRTIGNNFLFDNFLLRWLIGPQLAYWLIGQNIEN